MAQGIRGYEKTKATHANIMNTIVITEIIEMKVRILIYLMNDGRFSLPRRYICFQETRS